MVKRFYRLILVGLLSGQLTITGCLRTPTINQPAYGPFLRAEPIDEQQLNLIREKSPKDAVFADLLQAFALMRSGDITNPNVRKNILGLLMTSVSSFEDMTDPVNFSMAFSADEDKAFRGRPHERMFASTMAGIFLMAEQQCSQALPYFRNAEFLDARFQKLPFGTDAPLIYALMYRCLLSQGAAKSDINRAAEGVFRSVRFLTLQEPLVEALVALSEVDLRPMAIANRLAYMIYEISIYYSLMSAPDHFDADALLKDAANNAAIFVSALNTHFEDEYKERMRPLVVELARVYGMNDKKGLSHLEELTFDRVTVEASDIGHRLIHIFAKHPHLKTKINAAMAKTKELTDKILSAAAADKMIISFTGFGPTIVREGSYQEIAVIKPSPEGSLLPHIRQKDIKVSSACGFHRTQNEGFSVVLCQRNVKDGAKVEVLPSLELLSLSRKATTAQGRRFDKVLKGRAQFRAATENIAEISAWSALFLFHLGSQMIMDCQSRGAGESCYTKAYAVYTLAGITILFSGTIWLIGRTKNPAADSRFIHLMYESAWVSI